MLADRFYRVPGIFILYLDQMSSASRGNVKSHHIHVKLSSEQNPKKTQQQHPTQTTLAGSS